MNKPLKYSLIGIAGLLILVIAAAAVFVLTFDANPYKPQIERLVQEKTGRTLKLQGPLDAAVWPSLAAKVFKLATRTLAPGERFDAVRRQSFAPVSTRRHYPGEHAIELQVNGVPYGRTVFELEATMQSAARPVSTSRPPE